MQGPTQLLAAIDYTNHRGERRWRVILPHSIAYAQSIWHKEDGQQWILHATDVELNEKRDFKMADIHQWLAPKKGQDLSVDKPS
jgi:predicted DNA-binding transcriptional regulator YafY